MKEKLQQCIAAEQANTSRLVNERAQLINDIRAQAISSDMLLSYGREMKRIEDKLSNHSHTISVLQMALAAAP